VKRPVGYRFGDYWKLGQALLALVGVAAVLLVPVMWSFWTVARGRESERVSSLPSAWLSGPARFVVQPAQKREFDDARPADKTAHSANMRS
jgi:hypothetical protein